MKGYMGIQIPSLGAFTKALPAILGSLWVIFPSHAIAQSTDYNAFNGEYPKVLENINGVDIYSRGFQERTVDAAIGSEKNGSLMELVRTYSSASYGETLGLGHGLNWQYYLVEFGSGSYLINLYRDGYRSVFARTSGEPFYFNHKSDGDRLKKGTPFSGSSGYSLSTTEGDVIYFYRPSNPCAAGSHCVYRAQKMVRSNGSEVTFSYDSNERLQDVVNSFGYGFQFYYNRPGGGINQIKSFSSDCLTCTKNYLDTVDYEFEEAYSSAALGSLGPFDVLTNVKINNVNISTYTYSDSVKIASRYDGNSSTPAYINRWSGSGNMWTYTVYEQEIPNGGIHQFIKPTGGNPYPDPNYIDPSGAGHRYSGTYEANRPTLQLVKDPLGRITENTLDVAGRVTLTAFPGGGSVAFSYDDRGNITKTCSIGKSRFGQSCDPQFDSVVENQYLEGVSISDCIDPKTCNRISRNIDAKGMVTEYTWSSMHGSLLKEVSGLNISGNCLISGGVCPEKNYTYGTFSGINGENIYLLTSISEKISSSDSSVTNFVYQASVRRLLKEVNQTSGGVTSRTCFSYDVAGRIISQTQPNANMAACP